MANTAKAYFQEKQQSQAVFLTVRFALRSLPPSAAAMRHAYAFSLSSYRAAAAHTVPVGVAYWL